MNTVLWVAAGLLAAAFVAAGLGKMIVGKGVVEKGQAWAEDYQDRSVRLIGLAEVLGAVGVIVPPLVNVAVWLVPVAAIGLVVVMTGAARRHTMRSETIVPNVILGLLAAFVAVGRLWLDPFGA